MLRRPPALTPGQAAERTQAIAQRAGAWNRHATEAVRANLEVAIEKGELRLRIDYGGLKILHDLTDEEGKPLGKVGRVEVLAGDSGVHKDEGLADAGEPAPRDAAAPPAPPREAPLLDGEPMEEDAAKDAAKAAARLATLEERAATATARRRRQKQARKARDEAARLLAAQPGAQTGGGDAPDQQLHVPLWSATMGQGAAMVRLLGEVTERCARESVLRGVPTCAISVLYSGRPYSASVLSGTAATKMTASKCGEELLALLGGGLTEEGISTLLRRWSQAAAASGASRLAPAARSPSTGGATPPSGTHDGVTGARALQGGSAVNEVQRTYRRGGSAHAARAALHGAP